MVYCRMLVPSQELGCACSKRLLQFIKRLGVAVSQPGTALAALQVPALLPLSPNNACIRY